MRLVLISDIHANFEALSALTDVLTEADQVLCLGDLVGYYCQVNEVVHYVRSLNALCLMGNHDNFLLTGCPPDASPAVRFGIEFAQRVIDPDHRNWLESLPLAWGGVLGGRSFLLAHGSPWRPLGDYLYWNSPRLARFKSFDYDVVAFGQTHRTLVRMEHRPYLLNPGSVGQPRDVKAKASAIVVDTSTMTIETIIRPFDVVAVVQLAMKNGAREWVSKHFL